MNNAYTRSLDMDNKIYLIRHAETIDEIGIRSTNETMQEIKRKA